MENVHEAQPTPVQRMGDGEPPAGFDSFNWGAYLLPVIWGAAYGVWPLLGVWGLALLSSLFIAGMVPVVGEVAEIGPLILASIVTSVLTSGVRLWAGYRANRLAWKRNQRLAAVNEAAAARRPTVERFLGRQRTWAIVGWVIILGSTAAVLPVVYDTWQEYGLGVVGIAREVVWLLAEVGAAWWLAIKMREGALPEGPPVDLERRW